MDLPRISKLRWLDLDGTPVEGPREWTPALIELIVPIEDWQSVVLTRQGRVLQVYLTQLASQRRVLAQWPRSGTGRFKLRLEHGGIIEEGVVEIPPQKISSESYQKLLQDLTLRLPVAIAVGLQQAAGLAGIELFPAAETTLAQELTRLRRAVESSNRRPGLLKILPEVGRQYHQVLRSREFWVQKERARRPHPARLAQALLNGRNLNQDGSPKQIIDTRVEHSADTYENKLLKEYLHEVLWRLRYLLIALESMESLDQASLVRELLSKLARARAQAPFLDEVSLPHYLPTHVTMVLLKVPPYRATLEGYLELHKSIGVRVEEPGLDAPLEELPSLYQTWGSLKVLETLLDVAREEGYFVEQQHLVRRDASGLYIRIFPDGKPALILRHPNNRTEVRFIPERRYSKTGAFRSVTYEQKPDIAIEVVRPTGESWIHLFDPKYRLDSEVGLQQEEEFEEGQEDRAVTMSLKPKKADIDKIHAYRDAIRDESGNRIIKFACIMYPGPTVDYGHGIAALGAIPAADDTLQQTLKIIISQALSA